MDEFNTKILNSINELMTLTDKYSADFYVESLKILNSNFKDFSFAYFLIDEDNYSLKSAINSPLEGKKKYILKEEYVEEFFKNEKKLLKLDDDFKKNSFFFKLEIQGSIFGLFLISSNSDIEGFYSQFSTLANVLSYKIKDFELNQIYKLQLKAMQNAIIERDSAYSVIEKQHKKLVEVDKTKNLFLANISHELRTPLNAIIGFSQALSAQIFGSLNDKQAEYIKDIQISGLHLLGMINEILDLSKIEANVMKFNPIKLDPNVAINEVVNILEPLYKNKNIAVELNLENDIFLNADNQKFQQILYNLLSNAIKFTQNDGKIEIISKLEGDKYYLEIKDNGIGIDKKYHNKIFKKFVHLENLYANNQSSTGLGLTITKELVKLHNGKITLKSELNKGTSFIMEFKNILL